VIRKTKRGYGVFSSKGKKLGKDYKTRKEALKRLRQIEHFKKNGKKKEKERLRLRLD